MFRSSLDRQNRYSERGVTQSAQRSQTTDARNAYLDGSLAASSPNSLKANSEKLLQLRVDMNS